ncbi:MAG: hypothetical protein ABIH84_00205, partial [bacterium]
KKEIKLDAERIKYWLSQGAQVSDTVHNLLVKEKVVAGEKIKKKIRTKKGGKEKAAPTGGTAEDKKTEVAEASEPKLEPEPKAEAVKSADKKVAPKGSLGD